jgi:hypothetical protein
MKDTLTRYLSTVGSERDRSNLLNVLRPVFDKFSTRPLYISTPVISAGGAATAAMGAADSYYVAKGILCTVAANTVLPALDGTITEDLYNVFCFFGDSASALTSIMGTEGAAIADVVFPPIPEGKALLGFILISRSDADFVGGTTALDNGAVTEVYFAGTGGFDPTVLV